MKKKNTIIETLIQRGAEFKVAYHIYRLDKELCHKNHKNPSDSEYYETRFWAEYKAITTIVGDIAETEKEELEILNKLNDKSFEDEFIKLIFVKYELSLKNADEIKEHIKEGAKK